jgi:quercetin dioxygenase-like cupin family protein
MSWQQRGPAPHEGRDTSSRTILILLAVCAPAPVGQRPPVKCTEDSPERRGEEGCTILARRPLLGSLAKPVYWHIDGFDSLEAAEKAADPDGVAAEAHGSVWLMTVEAQTEEHHGERHAAWIGPPTLPDADRYTMRVQSSLLLPGATTPVHTHSGPEVFYVVDEEQCLETQEVGHRLGAGRAFVLPAGVVHRGRVTGSGRRRALALIVHDAARPLMPGVSLREPSRKQGQHPCERNFSSSFSGFRRSDSSTMSFHGRARGTTASLKFFGSTGGPCCS